MVAGTGSALWSHSVPYSRYKIKDCHPSSQWRKSRQLLARSMVVWNRQLRLPQKSGHGLGLGQWERIDFFAFGSRPRAQFWRWWEGAARPFPYWTPHVVLGTLWELWRSQWCSGFQWMWRGFACVWTFLIQLPRQYEDQRVGSLSLQDTWRSWR